MSRFYIISILNGIFNAELAVSTFTKDQILTSRRYQNRRDLIFALLKDGEKYSHAEVGRLIDEFMKGKVKKSC